MNIPMIIGNLCAFLGTSVDTLSSTRKTAKGMLWLQCLSQVFYGVGTFLLGGYSGVVQNVVSILRNLIAIKNISHPVLEWGLMAVGAIVSLACNNLGFWGLLPVIANCQYTLAVFRFKDNERALKFSFLILVALFVVFNGVIYNIVGVVTNMVVFVTTAIVLFKGRAK